MQWGGLGCGKVATGAKENCYLLGMRGGAKKIKKNKNSEAYFNHNLFIMKETLKFINLKTHTLDQADKDISKWEYQRHMDDLYQALNTYNP
jgi:hypothetical protein